MNKIILIILALILLLLQEYISSYKINILLVLLIFLIKKSLIPIYLGIYFTRIIKANNIENGLNKDNNFNNLILKNFDEVIKNFDYKKDFIKKITSIDNEVIVKVPVKFDNGKIVNFDGFRIQQNNLLGPYKGGLRFSKSINLNDIRALSFLMTIKCAVNGLPLGGGKGGIKYNPNDYSDSDNKKIAESFCRKIVKHIGPFLDIPGPDLGSNSKTMDWMTNEYMRIMNDYSNYGVFTGKSLKFKGSEGREMATGLGIFYNINFWYKNIFNQKLEKKKFIIQGLGNVGYWTSYYLSEAGAFCNGFGNRSGYYRINSKFYENNKFNDILKYNNKNKSLKNIQFQFEGIEKVSLEYFWKTKTDIVIPEATELQITKDNAHNLDCKLIAEGANGPCTLEVDKICLKKGIEIIPDVLCNSGGVIVSYFEWLQNYSNVYWTLDTVKKRLKEKLEITSIIYFNLRKMSEMSNITNRSLVYKIGLDNLLNAYEVKKN